MAPIREEATENIGSVSNHDFLKNHHCPMRTGNVRCRNISACSDSYNQDKSAPGKAINLRNQIIEQVKSFPSDVTSDAPIWLIIEKKIGKLLDYVLCKKHKGQQRDTAVRTTMTFLKEECGIFDDEEQSAETHTTQAPDDLPSLPAMSSNGLHNPSSLYATATSNLATPLESPARSVLQQTYHQHPSVFAAGQAAESSPPNGQHPQSAFDYRPNKPIKTEQATNVHQAQPQSFLEESFQAQSFGPQQTPTGFAGLAPASAEQDILSSTSTLAPPIKEHGRIPGKKRVPNTQSTKPQAPDGFTVRPRTKEESSIPQATEPKTPRQSSALPTKRSTVPPAAQYDAANNLPRSQIDEMVDNLEALELNNKKLAKENEKLRADNEKLEKDKLRLKAKYHKASDESDELADQNDSLKLQVRNGVDRIGDLQDANESLQSEAGEFKAKVEAMEKELAVLRRLVQRKGQ